MLGGWAILSQQQNPCQSIDCQEAKDVTRETSWDVSVPRWGRVFTIPKADLINLPEERRVRSLADYLQGWQTGGYVLLPKETDAERQIVKQVLSYFVRNPKAADSLEGVAHWRLLEEEIHRSVQQTEAALTWLVRQGFLQEIRALGSARLFRLNPERGDDAMRFLQERGHDRLQKRSARD